MDIDPLAVDYSRCFETPEGQRVLADIMTTCGVYDVVLAHDPVELGLATGARNVAMHIAAKLNFKPGDFPKRAERDDEILTSTYDYGGTQQ